MFEAPFSNPVRHEIVLWQEGVGERVIAEVGNEARLYSPAISGDGRRVVFLQGTGLTAQPYLVRLWDEATDTAETIFDFGFDPIGLDPPAIDGDGDRVVFSALIPPRRASQVFLWDEADGRRVSSPTSGRTGLTGRRSAPTAARSPSSPSPTRSAPTLSTCARCSSGATRRAAPRR